MAKYMRVFGILFCTCFFIVSCQQEELAYGNSHKEGRQFSISFSSEGMLEKYVVTSRSDVKTTDEQAVNSLHVFIFDKDGNFLEASEGNRYQGYRELIGKTVMNVDCAGWAVSDNAKTAKIVALANFESGKFVYKSADESTKGTLKYGETEISNYSSLMGIVYSPNDEANRTITELPENGMPMVGELNDCDLTGNTANNYTITMKALMARVDISLQINSEFTDVATGLLPSFTFTECKILNLPTTVPLSVPSSSTSSSYITKTFNPVVETIYNKGNGVDFSFYVYENIQSTSATYDYPTVDSEGNPLDEELKQLYKNALAAQGGLTDKALAVQLIGKYVTYNGKAYDAIYTLYLGANHTDNFTIGRNKQYKNNITIKGVTKTDKIQPGSVTLDTRVYISESNSFYISLLNERKLDSHFNVVPIDFYIFETGGTIDIEVPNDVNWIRMEKVSAAVMGGNNYAAGTGLRNYFTTDLVTTTLSGNSKYEGLVNRDRVYLYVDENTTNPWTLGSSDSRTRTATLKITYRKTDGTTIQSDLLIEQAKLLEVTFHDKEGNDSKLSVDYKYNHWNGKKFYIEMYEEYLDYRDPLDIYASNKVFNGLPWGANGVKIGSLTVEAGRHVLGSIYNGSVDCWKNYYWGIDFTKSIVSESIDDAAEISLADQILSSSPKTAAGYCYNKNKRNSSGGVDDGRWYLPGIRELERLLEDYYIEYPEFQNNFYWSSAQAEDDNGSSNARATKAYINNGEFAYYESNKNHKYTDENGTGGYAPRTTRLRIRCAYKP